jgi:serine/threonine protein kinase
MSSSTHEDRVAPFISALSAQQRFRREALVWRQLHHRYILPFIGLDEHTFREGDFLPCMVSPWMPRGTLREYVASDDYIPSRDLHRVVCHFQADLSALGLTLRCAQLSEAAEGLVYLHLQKFVHGDLNQVRVSFALLNATVLRLLITVHLGQYPRRR